MQLRRKPRLYDTKMIKLFDPSQSEVLDMVTHIDMSKRRPLENYLLAGDVMLRDGLCFHHASIFELLANPAVV